MRAKQTDDHCNMTSVESMQVNNAGYRQAQHFPRKWRCHVTVLQMSLYDCLTIKNRREMNANYTSKKYGR
jgi:hypothetical protein